MIHKPSFIQMEDELFCEVIKDKHGCLNAEEIKKILTDCQKKGIPFFVTDCDGTNRRRIV